MPHKKGTTNAIRYLIICAVREISQSLLGASVSVGNPVMSPEGREGWQGYGSVAVACQCGTDG